MANVQATEPSLTRRFISSIDPQGMHCSFRHGQLSQRPSDLFSHLCLHKGFKVAADSLVTCAGVIIHPTSLPGPNGIGEIGEEAFALVDWIASAGLSLWQVLFTPTFSCEVAARLHPPSADEQS